MNFDYEYRSMDLKPVDGSQSYIVEGYATTFEPYVLMTKDGVQYKEKIEPAAFDKADMSDVVFRVDHTGPVYARTTAGTVKLWHDNHGLGQRTDLSKTQRGRDLYEAIKAGNYPKMSFAFKVAENGDRYDSKTHTRIITRIAKVFDVSPVSFPANPGTDLSIATRDYFNGVIAAEAAKYFQEQKRAEKQTQPKKPEPAQKTLPRHYMGSEEYVPVVTYSREEIAHECERTARKKQG